MIHELRIYDIKKGKMDEWVELFEKQIIPAYKARGINIPGAWRRDESDEFVWFRLFDNEDEQKAKEKEVFDSAAFQAAMPKIRDCLEKVKETRNLTSIL